MYGVAGRRRYTRDLQAFAEKVASRRTTNGSMYIFGKTGKSILRDLQRRGIEVKSDTAAITDRTITKYINHPKKSKGAVVSFRRFRMVEAAVKHPKNVYIDTHRNRLVYVLSVKYSKDKVLKVILEPNQKMRGKYYNKVTSIGVVNRSNMNTAQYQKIK